MPHKKHQQKHFIIYAICLDMSLNKYSRFDYAHLNSHQQLQQDQMSRRINPDPDAQARFGSMVHHQQHLQHQQLLQQVEL